MRFFPIVPRNAPPDDLAKYLALYDAQAEALLASYSVAVHPEWDLNVPVPVMRSGGGLSGTQASTRALQNMLITNMRLSGLRDVGQPLGADPTYITDSSGNLIVSAVWAQRAMNGVLLPLQVDGVAGAGTAAALTEYWRRIGGASTGIAPSVTLRGTSLLHPGRVKMSPGMASRLSQHTQVADPPPPSHALPLPVEEEPVLGPVLPLPLEPSASGSPTTILAVLIGVVTLAWLVRRG